MKLPNFFWANAKSSNGHRPRALRFVMNALSLGFKILDFGALHGWKILELDASVPLSTEPNCPACFSSLETIVTLAGNGGQQRLRVGCCPACGYIGYIDRPTREWVRQFYLSIWDSAASKDVAAGVLKFREKITARDVEKGKRIANLLERFGVNKTNLPLFSRFSNA